MTPGWSTLLLGTALPVPDDRAFQAACVAHRVKVRSLGEAEVELACRGLALERCELEPTGALLIRPDDHVAWRQRAWVEPTAALVSSVVQQCYGSTLNHAGGGR